MYASSSVCMNISMQAAGENSTDYYLNFKL